MAGSITAKLIEGPHELRGKRITVAVDDPANPPDIVYVRWQGRAMWDFAVGSREQPRSRLWNLGYVRRGVEADNNGQWTYSFQLGATDPLD
jgi:hypothetical protein